MIFLRQNGRLAVHLLIFASIELSCAAFASAAEPDSSIPGTPIVGHNRPYTETFADIARRDQRRSAGPSRRQCLADSKTPVGRFAALRARQTATQQLVPESSPASSPPHRATVPGGATVAEPRGGNAQMIGATFRTVSQVDQDLQFDASWFPPSIAAAIGPVHLLEAVNQSVSVFSRAGGPLSLVTLESFLQVVIGPTTYPRGGASTPRVIYDRHSARWFVAALEAGSPVGVRNEVILAVSRGPDPLTSMWDKYVIPAGQPTSGMTTYATSSLTMGMDDNGLYFGVAISSSVAASFPVYKVVAISKPGLLTSAPSIETLISFYPITDVYGSLQPANNQDVVGPSELAWFVASSEQFFGNIHTHTLAWSAGLPTLSPNAHVLPTPLYGIPPIAPAKGGLPVYVTDDAMQGATIRNGRLWGCRNVGVSADGGAAQPINRVGCEWFELNVGGPTPSLVQLGRLYDSQSTGARSYYYPAIAVSAQGHAALGCSGSSDSEFITAFLADRLSVDSPSSLRPVQTIHAGERAYTQLDYPAGLNRWGEYSSAMIDPNDDMTLWTVQPYAVSLAANFWGTWAARLNAPPPFISFNPSSAFQGQTDVPLVILGADFFDPGPGFANRLTVAISGVGVDVTHVNYINPGRVEILVDISPTAPTGGRSLTLTNPDGQFITATGELTIQSPVACTTLFGDMDGDGIVDGRDVQGFADCYMSGSPATSGCGCGDLQRDDQFTHADVVLLKIKLLGFGSPTTTCLVSCPGDLNGDTLFDGVDIQAFLDCYRRGPFVTSGCPCADINEDNRVNDSDVLQLINLIMREDNSAPNCQ